MNADTPKPADRDAAFDLAMRDLHLHSLDRLQPATATRLRAARRARTHAEHRSAWGLAGIAAALCAVAVGLVVLLPGPEGGSPPATGPRLVDVGRDTMPSPATAALAAVEAEDALMPLDDDPDFYLWLAANDDALPSILER